MTVTVKALGQKDAHHLAPLIAAYAQAMRRGAPRRPDEYYAELLTADRTAEVLGAYSETGALIGFAVFFDLPDTITGLRVGQLDDIYVLPEFRNRGIGRRFVETLKIEGQSRGWARLRWIVPKPVDAAATGLPPEPGLYEEIASLSSSKLYEIPIDPLA
ncbi:GNAT family N-acetyltransferase [Chthonobacter albigriseus]|uniref:GNAT family N-acetyltransferase n=1 Tax=Chthonobacter albigriseus TaxID=1683161 RepID=UPI0015EE6231|nr:GNAT family N-acetyltransferase [Chthonobacter albigriseus]